MQASFLRPFLGFILLPVLLLVSSMQGDAQAVDPGGLVIEKGVDLKMLPVNGLDYCYLEAGEGDVIFFLHGFPDLATTWQDAMLELKDDYRCIAPFLRGYFPTSIPEDGDYSSQTIAEDIAALAAQLGIEEYYVVGHDWGASVAYSLANMVPERVKKLVSVAIPYPSFIKITPRLGYRARHFIRLRNEKSSLPYASKHDMRYIDRLFRRWSPGWTDYTTTRDEVLLTYRKPGRLEAALGYYWSLGEDSDNDSIPDFADQLPSMPLLVFAGKRDGALTMKPFKKMIGQMPAPFTLEINEEAGHFPHREAPAHFMEALRTFLEQE